MTQSGDVVRNNNFELMVVGLFRSAPFERDQERVSSDLSRKRRQRDAAYSRAPRISHSQTTPFPPNWAMGREGRGRGRLIS